MNDEQGFRKPRRIFAAGAAHVDRRGRSSAAFLPGASNPGRMSESPGGAIFNASEVLRRFGADVTLVSGRGGDGNGDLVADALATLRVADLALTWLDRRTPTYTAILDHDGDLVAAIADMDLYEIMRPKVFARRHIRDAIARCDAMMLDANLPAASIADLVERAGQRPVTAIGVSPGKIRRLSSVRSKLTAVFLSRAEAASFVEKTAIISPADLATALAASGCRRAVITDGPHDAAILDEGAVWLQAPPPVAALHDVTGAGDTLAAAATFSMLNGETFVDAARLGMVAASLRIAGAGDVPPDDMRRHATALPPSRLHQP